MHERVAQGDVEEESLRPDGIVLAELVTFIEETRATSDKEHPAVFKLSTLGNMYNTRIAQLLNEPTPRSKYPTRLKQRLLTHLPGLQDYKQGRNVYLAFRTDLAAVHSVHESSDEEAIHLARAASIVRKDMFSKKCQFGGSFEKECQLKSVPASLLSLVNMILYGASIDMQSDAISKSQAGLTVSQVIQFNSFIRRRGEDVKQERRNKNRETPLPLFVGLSIHAKTRSRDLIETMHDLGLSVSYDRVLAVSTDLGNAVCRRYQEDRVVCPPNLRLQLFTTAAVDNIDHNPSSTTANDSFHGTGISLFQHVTINEPGISRERTPLTKSAAGTKKVIVLPESYTQVPPASLPKKNIPVPNTLQQQTEDGDNIDTAFAEEFNWLQNVNSLIQAESLENETRFSWAAYHCAEGLTQKAIAASSAVSALLPLFPDEAKSVAMIKHSMNVIKASVEYINPGQIPVIAFDQPLYALAKQIQWNWRDIYGEQKFVVMFGGLHIEQAFLKTLGSLLEDSGWTAALVDADVATAGTADSFIKVANIKRTRKAHQVTVSALYALLQSAYAKYQQNLDDDDCALSFDDWCAQKALQVPQFHIWYLTMQLELLLLIFLRSIRQANFSLYVDSIAKMLPWFFALNHHNYARWLSVHLLDMHALPQTAPGVARWFDDGFFTVNRSSKRFSAIAIDQAHEQNNAIVKGDGGAVGLTENPSALRRWMVSGPEIARVVNEFENEMKVASSNDVKTDHHEENRSFQMTFFKDVKSLVASMEDLL